MFDQFLASVIVSDRIPACVVYACFWHESPEGMRLSAVRISGLGTQPKNFDPTSPG